MNSHYDPNHPRFCSPQAFRSIYSFRRNRPARTTRKQSLSFAPPPIGRAKINRKHRATMARRAAFLDLNAATERNKRAGYSLLVAAATGLETSAKPEDMEAWMNRYRAAVENQREVFSDCDKP